MPLDSPDMSFRTPVSVGAPQRLIGVGDMNVFLGSCFAEHVGRCFFESRLRTLVNPTGVLYNPQSIALLLCGEADDAVFHQGLWHSWLGDSTLSRPEREECLRAASEALETLRRALAVADNLFLTLGTSHCYVYKPTCRVVANCHRLPATEFDEVELTQEEIVEALDGPLNCLHERNPRLQVILTVSPYRYAKYGFHASQLSKARLLLSADQLCQRHPGWVNYFPAYEILLDELRDYRFYADDMLHPSAQAIHYIWSRLVGEWSDASLQTYLQRWEPIGKALGHRPVNPIDPASEAFRQRTLLLLQALQDDYPMLPIKNI